MSPYELVDSEKAAFLVGVLCEAVGVERATELAVQGASIRTKSPASQGLPNCAGRNEAA